MGCSNNLMPLSMLLRYWNLEVDFPGGQRRIAVNSYKCRRPEYGGTVNEEKIKDAFLSVSNGKILSEVGGAEAYVSAFVGKGSPETLEKLIPRILAYKDAFLDRYRKSETVPYKKCAELLGGVMDGAPVASDDAMMQRFCDRYIGLDCNGFVGNYTRAAQHDLGLGPSSSIQSGFYPKRVATRRSVDEVQPRDLIIWEQFQHIAVIDALLPESGKMWICQSTAGGPQASRHGLVHVTEDLFRIEPTATRFKGNVRIVSVGLCEEGAVSTARRGSIDAAFIRRLSSTNGAH